MTKCENTLNFCFLKYFILIVFLWLIKETMKIPCETKESSIFVIHSWQTITCIPFCYFSRKTLWKWTVIIFLKYKKHFFKRKAKTKLLNYLRGYNKPLALNNIHHQIVVWNSFIKKLNFFKLSLSNKINFRKRFFKRNLSKMVLLISYSTKE